MKKDAIYLYWICAFMVAVVCFCSMATLSGNECRVNPYSSPLRRILASVSLYLIAFLSIIGGLLIMCKNGYEAWENFTVQAAYVKNFIELKGCSD